MFTRLRQNWPEYFIEAWALGTFMISAALFTALLEYAGSPVHHLIPNGHVRRALIGIAMGLTAISLIYSPWGQRSGAHMNPAFTLTFLRLGKIKPWDALFYIMAQFIGGTAGIVLSKLVLGEIMTHSTVNHVVTVPGQAGTGVAFGAETIIAGGMMLMVLWTTNTPSLPRFTGLFAGTLVFLFITFEAPLSGMSMNPARTAASALPSGIWTSGWIYFTAPLLGMFLAVEIYHTMKGLRNLACPKYYHGATQRCIFCGFPGTASVSCTKQFASTRKELASATTNHQ